MKIKQDEPQTTAERRQNVMFYVLAPQHEYTRVMSYIHTAFLCVTVRSIKAYYTVQTIINFTFRTLGFPLRWTLTCVQHILYYPLLSPV